MTGRQGIVFEGEDMYFVHDGVRIAKRGKPGTPQAMTWITLVPGWTLTDRDYPTKIDVTYDPPGA